MINEPEKDLQMTLSKNQINLVPSRDQSRDHWGEKAQTWTKWADPMAAMSDSFNQPLLDAVEVVLGDEVLDLASGVGEPAFSALKRVGEAGRVVATDFVPEMLYGIAGQSRAKQAEQLNLVAADMLALPFKPESFDKILCRFGIMFVPDVKQALGEAVQVLRQNGRAAFMVWGNLEQQTVFSVIDQAMSNVVGEDSDDHIKTIFRFGPAGSLAAEMALAGFVDVEEHELHFAPRVPVGKKFWSAPLHMSFGHVMVDFESDKLAQINTYIEDGFSPYVENGHYHLKAHIRIASGRKP
jgi:ubiquinone/menaquinone biosynthesis C-methylase UbiE